MAYEFKLPDLGEGLTEGEIARWLVSEGQEVAEDDPLVEIQTDKTTVEIPSPAAGKVARILVAEGEVVPVGTVLVVIGEDGARRAATARRHAATPQRRELARRPGDRPGQTVGRRTGRVRATPLVRRIAAGARRRPRSRRGDWAAGSRHRGGRPPRPRQALSRTAEGRREPLRGVRRLIAEHMARAHREVPPVTWVEECDFGARRPQAARADGAEGRAPRRLQEFPELNARLEGDADRLPRPLRPRRRRPDRPGPRRPGRARLRREEPRRARRRRSSRLADAARAGTLKPEELRGSTFTVTSAGKLGGLLTTPIVNHPEVAILSIGRIAERPVVRDGEIVGPPGRNDLRSRSTTV